MLAKRFRRWVSWIAMGAFGFAQIAVALHACPVEAAAPAGVTTAAPAHRGIEPCTDLESAPAGAQSNDCESHCAKAIVAPAQPDPPAAAFTALPAPPSAVVEVRASRRAAGERLVAVSRAPPVTLQFCRLLI
jgi:hypothetical protein